VFVAWPPQYVLVGVLYIHITMKDLWLQGDLDLEVDICEIKIT